MAAGIKITVKMFQPVRELRKDDVEIRMWTGMEWVWICRRAYTPRVAELYGFTPYQYAAPLNFLPPGVVPRERLLYERKYLPGLRRDGIVR